MKMPVIIGIISEKSLIVKKNRKFAVHDMLYNICHFLLTFPQNIRIVKAQSKEALFFAKYHKKGGSGCLKTRRCVCIEKGFSVTR